MYHQINFTRLSGKRYHGEMFSFFRKNQDEFDLYCHNKTKVEKELLRPVRDLIVQIAIQSTEGRVRFYLQYYYMQGSVAKLFLNENGLPQIDFVVGKDLSDPKLLLKGDGELRSLIIKSSSYLDENQAAITEIIKQAESIIVKRMSENNITSKMQTLTSDQATT